MVTDTPELRASNSTILDWRDCEQRYWYRYVKRLQPKVEDAAPLHLGRVLHTYLERYYAGLKAGEPPDEAHGLALAEILTMYEGELNQLSDLAAAAGQEDLARELADLVPRATILAIAYYRVHGLEDAERHEVLYTEVKFDVPVKDGVVLPGRIDLVTRDRTTGDLVLWEHKSTKRIPRQQRRLCDLQTLLYHVALEIMSGDKADRVLWNYINTAPPHAPKLLKKAPWISQAKDQCTTAELYVKALRDNAELLEEKGLGADDFVEAVANVRERERVTMFPRFEMPVLARADVVLRDYLSTVVAIERAHADPDFIPVRNVGYDCDWCPFGPLCAAVITGGSEKREIKKRFTVKPPWKPSKETTNGNHTPLLPAEAASDEATDRGSEADPLDGI